MSYLDYIFIGIVFACICIGFRKGLIKMVYSLGSTIIGIFLAYLLYPQVSSMLIKYTKIYDFIMNKAIKALNLNQLAENAGSHDAQIQLIKDLKVPHFIKNILIEDNNQVVYDLLKATGIEQYIGGTIATIAINALAFLIVLVLVILLLNIISHVLHIVSKLPVIHQLDKVGGLAAGLLQGIILLWIICILISFVIAIQGNEKLFILIDKSPIVTFFYNNNLIIGFISNLSKTLLK